MEAVNRSQPVSAMPGSACHSPGRYPLAARSALHLSSLPRPAADGPRPRLSVRRILFDRAQNACYVADAESGPSDSRGASARSCRRRRRGAAPGRWASPRTGTRARPAAWPAPDQSGPPRRGRPGGGQRPRLARRRLAGIRRECNGRARSGAAVSRTGWAARALSTMPWKAGSRLGRSWSLRGYRRQIHSYTLIRVNGACSEAVSASAASRISCQSGGWPVISRPLPGCLLVTGPRGAAGL